MAAGEIVVPICRRCPAITRRNEQHQLFASGEARALAVTLLIRRYRITSNEPPLLIGQQAADNSGEQRDCAVAGQICQQGMKAKQMDLCSSRIIGRKCSAQRGQGLVESVQRSSRGSRTQARYRIDFDSLMRGIEISDIDTVRPQMHGGVTRNRINGWSQHLRASARTPGNGDQPFGFENAHRLPQGRPRDAEGIGQRGFGRQIFARNQRAADNLFADVIGNQFRRFRHTQPGRAGRCNGPMVFISLPSLVHGEVMRIGWTRHRQSRR